LAFWVFLLGLEGAGLQVPSHDYEALQPALSKQLALAQERIAVITKLGQIKEF
jgi:hypothetical protein